MFDKLVMRDICGHQVPAVEIDTPHGQIYAYKIKDEFVYEFPSGRARRGAQKFFNGSAEDIKTLLKILQDQL
ncbi:MAG TPA: hypothetical protein PKI94_07680 [Candidatus Gastranaerophilaceae bacterium]|nr:hypothetical protein [Candidatus Gastranaerophilaceae bacterium]